MRKFRIRIISLLERICFILSKLTGNMQQKSSSGVNTKVGEVVPRYLCIIGKRAEEKITACKINDFIEWLKANDKNVYKKYKKAFKEIKSNSFIDGVKYLISCKGINLNDQLFLDLHKWSLFQSFLVFNGCSQEVYYITELEPELLKAIYRIEPDRIIDPSKLLNDLSLLGDISFFYKIDIVCYGLEKREQNIINKINACVNQMVINWKFYDETENLKLLRGQYSSALNNSSFYDLSHITSRKVDKKEAERKVQDFSFNEFFKSAKNTFDKLCNNDEQGEKLKDIYDLHILPRQNDNTFIRVFWGNRAYSNSAIRGLRMKIESGCQLGFQKLPSGKTYIYMFPGKLDDSTLYINGVLLFKNVDSNKLLNEKFIKSCWDDFMAYTLCHSLDGEPSKCQYLRNFCIVHFYKKIKDGEELNSDFTNLFKYVSKWVLTVGLSGALLGFIQCIGQKTTVEDDHIERIDSISEEILNKDNTISNDIKSLKIDANFIKKHIKEYNTTTDKTRK